MKNAVVPLPMRIAVAVLIIAAVCFGIWLIYMLETYNMGHGIPCPIHRLTGLYCPGCGSGRAMRMLMYGHPILALRQNPLFVTVFPAVLLYGICRLFDWTITGKNHIDKFVPDKLLIGIFAVLIIFAVLRNIPAENFSILRPFPL